MSSTTPRKQRHHQNNPSTSNTHGRGHQRTRSQHLAAQSAQQAPTSDYESDTAFYNAAHPPPPTAALAQRTNTELNLSVLRRYLPSIAQISGQAANAVIYTYDHTAQSWDRAGVEGPMFVCAQNESPLGIHDGPVAWGGEKGCLFIINRRGLDNMILELEKVGEIEVATGAEGEMLAMMLKPSTTNGSFASGPDADGKPKVMGVYIHADTNETRAMNHALVQQLWAQVQEAEARRLAAGDNHVSMGATMGVEGQDAEVGPALQAIGRRVDVAELFANNS